MPIANSLKQVKGFTRLGGDYFWCDDYDLIQEQEGFNPRNYERRDVAEHIRKLADAYKRGEDLGAWDVVVIDGVVYVREGHCRRRGRAIAIAEGAELGRILVKELHGDETEGDFKILTSQGGLKLSPVERGMIYRRLINKGKTITEVAIREGLTEVAIRNCLAVYDLPLALKSAIENGTITMTLALELFRDYGTKAVNMIDSAIQIRQDEAAKSEERMRETAALGDLFDEMPVDTAGLDAPTTTGVLVGQNNKMGADASSNVLPFNRDTTKPASKAPAKSPAKEKAPAPIKLTRKDLIKKPKKRSDDDVEMAFSLLREIRKSAESQMKKLANDDHSLPFMDDSMSIELNTMLLNDLYNLLNKQ